MRSRNQLLKVGYLLVHDSETSHLPSRGMFFLVEGASDVLALRAVENVVSNWVSTKPTLHSHVVANLNDVSGIVPGLNPSTICSYEVAEFASLEEDEVKLLLEPALARLMKDEHELFPSASGALGGIAKGIHFLDREDHLDVVKQLVIQGTSLLVCAPRRSGKTSFLIRVGECLDGSVSTYFVDPEGDRSLVSFAVRILGKVTLKAPGVLRREASAKDWRTLLREAIGEVATHRPAALMLDELSAFLQNIEGSLESDDVEEFLRLLGECCEKSNVPILVAGSDDLSRVLQDSWGINIEDLGGVFAHIRRYPLPPMPEDRVRLECRRLLIGSRLVPQREDLEWLGENLDFQMPYAARLFIDALGLEVESKSELAVNDLDLTLKRFLNDTKAFSDIERCIDKIAQKYSGQVEACYSALTHLANVSKSGQSVDEMDFIAEVGGGDSTAGKDVLSLLREVIPVECSDGKLKLTGRLFRAWWLHREGQS